MTTLMFTFLAIAAISAIGAILMEVNSTREGEDSQTREDTEVLFFTKGQHKYVFMYRNSNMKEVLRRIGMCAGNPDLNLSWFDAEVLTQKVRQGNHPRRNRKADSTKERSEAT